METWQLMELFAHQMKIMMLLFLHKRSTLLLDFLMLVSKDQTMVQMEHNLISKPHQATFKLFINGDM
jgi:hypothetical protein